MFITTAHTDTAAFDRGHAARARPQKTLHGDDSAQHASELVVATLKLLGEQLHPVRRVVHAGEVLYRSGDAFTHLHVLNSGFFKQVKLTADGREQVLSLKFRGDWLGFDGIANGRCACNAVAMDTGEVWSVPYDQLLASCAALPALLAAVHEAMSREMACDRNALMSVCTLPADARVADFLHHWADSLARRGLRNDQISLRMTRAEIGNHLGMTLESVSRALSRLARMGAIEFAEKARREIRIPDVAALADFVQLCLAPPKPTLQ